jgi:hypothetical protein
VNSKTLLLRHLHPSFINHGRVTTQVFRPTLKDQLKLLVYDGDMISPDDAFGHYTQKLQLWTYDVLVVMHEECADHQLQVNPDSETFAGLVLIDFSGLIKSQVKTRPSISEAKHIRVAGSTRYTTQASPNGNLPQNIHRFLKGIAA